MKTYSVKEVAEMLHTNPETVRRWIRNGKLQAVKTSRRKGHIITEGMLRTFIKATPKYAKLTSSIMMISTIAGIPAAAATIAASTMITEMLISNEKSSKARISITEMENKVKELIRTKREAIMRKEETIRQIQEEIEQDRASLREVEKLLDVLKEQQ